MLASDIPQAARDALLSAALSLSCTVITGGRADRDDTGDDTGGAASFSYRSFSRVRIPLSGDHQRINLATAAEVMLSPPVLAHVRAVSASMATVSPSVLFSAFATGISTLVRWPARLQPLVYMQRLVLLDGSHNEEAGMALATFVSSEFSRLSRRRSSPRDKGRPHGVPITAATTHDTTVGINGNANGSAHGGGNGSANGNTRDGASDATVNGHTTNGTANGCGGPVSHARSSLGLHAPGEDGVRVNWIVGMLRGKDHRAYLTALLRADRGDTLACVPVLPNVSWQAGAPPKELAEIASMLLPQDRIRVCGSVEEAVTTVPSYGGAARAITVVCGSLHLCGMVLAHAEVEAKSTAHDQTPLHLLETMRYCTATGQVLLFDSHVARLADAAARFGYAFDAEEFERCVDYAISAELARTPAADLRLRCTVSSHGEVSVKAVPMPLGSPAPLMTLPLSMSDGDGDDDNSVGGDVVSLSVLESPALDPMDPYLSFKTTRRWAYANAMAQRPHPDETSDVVLVNHRGEVTEATIYNIAVVLADEAGWITPPLSSGLLGGVMRHELLARGAMTERVITLSSLRHAKAVCVMNSVRGVQRARLVW